MMSDDTSQQAQDALAIAQRALAKINDLERENEDLRERLVKVEIFVGEMKDKPYKQLSVDTKIGMVREHVYEKAKKRVSGRAAIDYDDVMWGVFEGEPAPSHCYKLMQRASDIGGFRCRDPDDGNKQLTVDVAEAKKSMGMTGVNNPKDVFPENKDRGSLYPENKDQSEGFPL
jgi:hypothetical protein